MSTPVPPSRGAGHALGQSLASALDGSEPLVGLLARVHESRRRLQALAPAMPEALRELVRPGPLDDTAWVLLVPHAAAAAKLRQLLPRLHETLCAHGWPGPPIKIKVLPRA